MDTSKLRYFTVIAETGSLTKAAKILGISHSGLSKAISALENEVNMQIFRPHGRGLEITLEGKWLYKKAQEILKITSEIDRGQRTERSTLRIGLSGVIAMTCAGHLAHELNTPLMLSEIDVGDVEGRIISGEIDYGIAFIPSPRPEMEYLEIGSVEFNSYAREDLSAKVSPDKIPYVVPTSEFTHNPLGYRNRDGWPNEIPRSPYFYVSSFAIALNLLREGKAGIYMPDFAAALENLDRKTGKKIVKIKVHSAAESVRQLFLVKTQASAETREMKKTAKVMRKICCR